MNNSLLRALANPWAGLAALVAVIVLGLALIVTALTAARTETALRGRIAALTAECRRAGEVWGANLAACETGGAR
ncbi:MAG: hypothetical protein JWQ29_2749, partial [Phenylobacterium sp.]|nr:hypothetical protein [Phenylobacterium sp.]